MGCCSDRTSSFAVGGANQVYGHSSMVEVIPENRATSFSAGPLVLEDPRLQAMARASSSGALCSSFRSPHVVKRSYSMQLPAAPCLETNPVVQRSVSWQTQR